MLARDGEGRFVRGVLGPAAFGPVLERIPEAERRGVQRLREAVTTGSWQEADEALFGQVPSLIQTVVAQLPLQQPSRTQALELRRLPASAVSPGVVYLFVMTLRPEVRRP
jgi:hypothetical protein